MQWNIKVGKMVKLSIRGNTEVLTWFRNHWSAFLPLDHIVEFDLVNFGVLVILVLLDGVLMSFYFALKKYLRHHCLPIRCDSNSCFTSYIKIIYTYFYIMKG